jgi:hypothetical protein
VKPSHGEGLTGCRYAVGKEANRQADQTPEPPNAQQARLTTHQRHAQKLPSYAIYRSPAPACINSSAAQAKTNATR